MQDAPASLGAEAGCARVAAGGWLALLFCCVVLVGCGDEGAGPSVRPPEPGAESLSLSSALPRTGVKSPECQAGISELPTFDPQSPGHWLDEVYALRNVENCGKWSYQLLQTREAEMTAETRPIWLRRMGIIESNNLYPLQTKLAYEHFEAAAPLFEQQAMQAEALERQSAQTVSPTNAHASGLWCELLVTRRFELQMLNIMNDFERARTVLEAGLRQMPRCTNPLRQAEFWEQHSEYMKRSGQPLAASQALDQALLLLPETLQQSDVYARLAGFRIQRRALALKHDLGEVMDRGEGYSRQLDVVQDALAVASAEAVESSSAQAPSGTAQAPSGSAQAPSGTAGQKASLSPSEQQTLIENLRRERLNLEVDLACMESDLAAVGDDGGDTFYDPHRAVTRLDKLLRESDSDPKLKDRLPAVKLTKAWALTTEAVLDLQAGDRTDVQSRLEQAQQILKELPDIESLLEDETLVEYRAVIAIALGLARQTFEAAMQPKAGPNVQSLTAIEQALVELAPKLTQREMVWRTRGLLASYYQARGQLRNAREVLWQAIVRLEDERRSTQDRYPFLAWQSQRAGLYGQWLSTLVEAWQHPTRTAQGALPLKVGPEPDVVREAHARSYTQFVEAPVTPDTLLAAVEYLSARDFMEEFLADQGGVLQVLAAQRELGSSARTALAGLNLEQTGAELRSWLPPGVPVFVYFPLPDQVLVLEVRREETRAQLLPLSLRQLQTSILGLRKAYNQVAENDEYQAPAEDVELTRLGEQLLKPVWERLPTDRDVGFLMQGTLGILPLNALRVGDQYLAQKVYPFGLPALSLVKFTDLSASASVRTQELVTLALSVGTDAEIQKRELALFRGQKFLLQKLVDRDATRRAVESRLESVQLLHVNGHGLSARHTTDDARPGLEGGATLKLADGDLSAQEVAKLDLRRLKLGVLASCELAVGKGGALNGSTGAFTRAIQMAGGQAAIAAQWSVGEETTYRLMRELYQRYPEQPRARALAEAQRAMIASQDKVAWGQGTRRISFSTTRTSADALLPKVQKTVPLSAPWSWAGFSLSGRWD